MGKKPFATAITRKNLIDAFYSEYSKKTINQITIQTICKLAGYNRSTFYQYFIDIYDLLDKAENELISQILSDFQLCQDVSSIQMINYLASIYDKYGELLDLFFGSNGNTTFSQKYKASLKPILCAYYGIESQDTQFNIFYEYTMSGIIAAFSYWYSHRTELSSDKLSEIIQELLSNGIKHYL